MTYIPISEIVTNAAREHYFVSKNGSDSNDGRSWSTAKLTIDAAKGNNRKILVGPGVYSETLDWSSYSGVELVSAVKWAAKITGSGVCVALFGSSTNIRGMWIDSTNTAVSSAAAQATSENDVWFNSCRITSTCDGIKNNLSSNFKVTNCFITGSEYAFFAEVNSGHTVIEDSFLVTDGLWETCNSYALATGAINTVVNRCVLFGKKTDVGANNYWAGGLLAVGTTTVLSVSGCTITARNTHTAAAGSVGIHAQYGGSIVANECIVATSTDVGNAYDLKNEAGTVFSVNNTSYSTTNGTITDRQQAILDLVTP